jgi:RHS repeat-associated protein
LTNICNHHPTVSCGIQSYKRARYYDPQAGRFIGEDQVGFRSGTDFYTYVRNSPVVLVDPTGNYITPIGSPQDIKDLGLAIAYLRQDPVMAEILIRAATDPNTEYIIDMKVGPADEYNWTRKTKHYVHWNPHLANRACEGGPYQSPALGLGHEKDHVVNGPDDQSQKEEMRVINGSEAHAAQTLGEPRRYDHSDHGDKYVNSPVPPNWPRKP